MCCDVMVFEAMLTWKFLAEAGSVNYINSQHSETKQITPAKPHMVDVVF